jgi:ribosome biogenesis GTPase A
MISSKILKKSNVAILSSFNHLKKVTLFNKLQFNLYSTTSILLNYNESKNNSNKSNNDNINKKNNKKNVYKNNTSSNNKWTSNQTEYNNKKKNDNVLISKESNTSNKVKGFLEVNTHLCSGCGTPFQSRSEDEPGFLPKEKFKEHRHLAKIVKEKQEAIKILEMAGIEVDSESAEEILTKACVSPEVIAGVRALGEGNAVRCNQFYDSSISTLSEEERTFNDLDELKNQLYNVDEPTICICQRCFKLNQHGTIDESLRPGWSKNELLSPERFETLLSNLKSIDAVILCIIDVFDLRGSLLSNLKNIAGNNPIVIATNKVDLLPTDVSNVRLTNWIYNEVKEYCNLKSPKDVEEDKKIEMVDKGWVRPKDIEEFGVLRRSNIHLVSCQTGFGIDNLMNNLISMANDNGKQVYVMGAANVGKSSFINKLLDNSYNNINSKSNRKSNRKNKIAHATVSNLPGTTLDFLKIKLPNGITMIDTPGLINKGQLTTILSSDELKHVIPNKRIKPITLRVVEGQKIMLGGLASIELIEGRSFFFTFFLSNDIKIHSTSGLNDVEFIEKHIGTLLSPPFTIESYRGLGEFEDHIFKIGGDGWLKSSTDIIITGLGWISFTGSGDCTVKVKVPKGTLLGLRSALLPFESQRTTGKVTGGKIVQRSKKSGSSKGWKK